MFAHRKPLIIVTAVSVLFVLSAVLADTWQLSEEGRLKSIEQQGEFGQAVTRIKQFAEEGEIKQFQQALNELKKNFSEIAGPELDAYMKAEALFCNGKFQKAFIAYDRFLNRFGESSLYEAALDRQFAIGNAFLHGRPHCLPGRRISF